MSNRMFDAQAALGFLAAQTSHIEAQVAEVVYPEIQYSTLIPVDTSAAEWAKSITFYSKDMVGKANWFNHMSQDISRADALRDKHERAIEMAEIGYGYSLEELGVAMMTGTNLSADRAIAANRAYEEFVDEVALQGRSEKNLEGLVSYTGVTAADAPNDGTSSSRYWADKTADLILRDVNSLLTGVFESSNTVELADTLLLPISAYTLIATKRITDTTMTVLQFLQTNNIYSLQSGRPLTIRYVRGLEDAAAGGAGRAVAYRRDPLVLKFHLPMPHRFLPVWQTGPMYFDVPGIFRLGGLEIRRPGGVRYLDLIQAPAA